MERYHDELRQEDRGIKRGGLKDSDEHIRKRNKVMGNEVEMHREGYRHTEMRPESEMTDDDRQSEGGDNQSDGYDSQPDDSDDESEGGEDADRDGITYMKGFCDIKFVGDKFTNKQTQI